MKTIYRLPSSIVYPLILPRANFSILFLCFVLFDYASDFITSEHVFALFFIKSRVFIDQEILAKSCEHFHSNYRVITNVNITSIFKQGIFINCFEQLNNIRLMQINMAACYFLKNTIRLQGNSDHGSP